VGRASPVPHGPERATWAARASLARLAALALLGLAALLAAGAAPRLRPPREPAEIRRILADGAHAGDCDRCHSMHAEGQPVLHPNALIGPDDNSLCDGCHVTPWEGGSYAGTWLYVGSSHGSDANVIWPGPEPPARIEPDAANKCLSCHDPHGWTDATGEIPHLMVAREERLCLACHDGAPASKDVSADFQKAYRHPVADYSGRHTGPGESQPSDYGTTPLNRRHSECEDCHNPHVLRADGPLGPTGSDASKTTLGVSRVLVLNGAAGTPPSYTFVAGSDTLTPPVAEYQLCFKCHSSWTTQPTGQTDFARVLNPANPSYHPVEDVGTNPGIAPLAFVPGWSASSLTRCADCHGSDFGTARGPHGSSYPDILKRPYVASSVSRVTTSDEECFLCHSYDVYANPGSPESVRAYSRFNRPGVDKGHAEHVGEQNVPCYACHVTHGSTTEKHLIATGRDPGLLNYAEGANGGTCSPTCHSIATYTINYAR
jgi:predicted CXXCH cytochrome family protein